MRETLFLQSLATIMKKINGLKSTQSSWSHHGSELWSCRRSLMAEAKAEWFFPELWFLSALCVVTRSWNLPRVAWETNVSICALSTLWCGLQHSKWHLVLMCPQDVRLWSEPSLWPAIAPTRYLSSLWNVTCLPSLPMCQITCHLAIRPTLNVLPWCSVPNEKVLVLPQSMRVTGSIG